MPKRPNTSDTDRFSGRRPFPRALLPALLVAAALFLPVADALAFVLYFDTTAYNQDVWLQVQDPNFASTTTNFQATYNNGQSSINFQQNGAAVLMSVPVKLSDIGSGGLNITFSESAVFFIYYDDPSANSRTAAPAHMSSTQRFQPFEVTMMGNPGDQGNLTAINYFTAPLGIKSYQNDPMANPAEPVLQQTGYGSNTAGKIGGLLNTACGGAAGSVITNQSGQVIRYLGPSNFTGTNPWPSFLPYLQSINAAGQTTTIQRTNGFNFAAPYNTPVYQFGGNMTATANADGSLTVSGSVTVSANTAVSSGNPAIPTGGAWSDATITFSAADVNALNDAIYGQVVTSAVTFSGTAWSNFQTFTDGTLMNPALPHSAANPSLSDLGAFSITQAMLIGEITTGLLGGFFNSDYQVNGVAIKNMISNDWWSLNPIVAYSQIQPSNAYYNPYANVIFNTSNNTVYGVPYSDRFGQGPLVNTVNLNGTSVNYWIVSVGAPLPGSPGTTLPGVMMLLSDEPVPAAPEKPAKP